MVFDSVDIAVGDEVLYVGKNRTCCLLRGNGEQVGVEVEAGIPKLVGRPYGFADGDWTREKTMAIASSLARQAGLQGTIEHVEGSISTIHRVRIRA